MAENKNAKTPADDDQPVAWFSTSPDGKLSNKFAGTSKEVNWTPIYTELPKQWVGLTDEEVKYIADSEWEEAFVRLVETKLKEKNT